MKPYIHLTLIFMCSLVHSISTAQDTKPRPKAWLARLAELERELRSDKDRNDPYLCADLSAESLDPQHESLLRRLHKQMEELADQYTSVLTLNERKLANRQLTNLEFDAPTQMAKDDLRQIADYFVKNPILDPRILQIEMEDENTVRIRSGVVRGPLAGGGCTYIARRENGKWIVRIAGHWVS